MTPEQDSPKPTSLVKAILEQMPESGIVAKENNSKLFIATVKIKGFFITTADEINHTKQDITAKVTKPLYTFSDNVYGLEEAILHTDQQIAFSDLFFVWGKTKKRPFSRPKIHLPAFAIHILINKDGLVIRGGKKEYPPIDMQTILNTPIKDIEELQEYLIEAIEIPQIYNTQSKRRGFV